MAEGSEAARLFKANVDDVDTLVWIHGGLRTATLNLADAKAPGRPLDYTAVLHKGAIVLLVSCWEAYVEDACREAFDFLLSEASSASRIPERVRRLATMRLQDGADGKDPIWAWALSDRKWKTVLRKYAGETLGQLTERWHSPKSQQVDTLVNDLIGLSRVSSHWHWPGMGAQRAAERLDALVELRGDLAHRGPTEKRVTRTQAVDSMMHIVRLVRLTDNAISEHLASDVGSAPWEGIPPYWVEDLRPTDVEVPVGQ